MLITGAAGLVGQNLIPKLLTDGNVEILAIDKHKANVEILRKLHPELSVVQADLSEEGDWELEVRDIDAAILLHAQIGGLDPGEFESNNVTATRRALDVCERADIGHLIHVSSSVVNSAADDFYTRTKSEQERLVAPPPPPPPPPSPIPKIILRPTLMFGWFDRKHFGWLRRFMDSSPVFPIPGDGRYPRQPLYAGDFSSIVASCLSRRTEGTYNISGLERLDYVDIVREIKKTAEIRTPNLHIPCVLFGWLLALYAVFDRDPPFTTAQLKALVTPDVFEVIDWPTVFDVVPTNFETALRQTFGHPVYSKVVLEF